MYSSVITSPGRPAPPDGRATRGVARRELLMRTTLELIAERGIDAVNHRSVAEAAGVPLGSTTYWFDSRQHMLGASLEHFARLEIEALNERLEGLSDGDDSIDGLADAFTALLVPQLSSARTDAVALYTLLNEAPRHPELEAVCREWTSAWTDALAELFGRLGAPDPELEARMLLAMLDGLLLNQLATPEPDVEEAVIRPALLTWFRRVTAEAESESKRKRPTKGTR